MKAKFLVLILALVGSLQLTFGQEQSTHKRGGKIAQELNLTEDQKVKFKQIHQKYKPQIKTIKQDSSLVKKEKRSQIKNLKGQMDSDFKTILSVEQYQRFQEIKQERKSKRKQKHQ